MSVLNSLSGHVYHISPRRRWMLAWIFGPILLGALVICAILPGEGRMIAGWMFVILLAMALGMQWLIDRAKLEVSPAGVVLRQTGYTLMSSWANIQAMRLDHGQEAFITRVPLDGKGLELLAATSSNLRMYDARHHALLNEHRLVPFEAFAWHLRHGELRAQIESYAPHLCATLASLDSPAGAVPPCPPLTGKAKMQIAILIAVFGGIGWLVLSSNVNRPLVDTIFGTMALLAATGQSCYAARNFLRRRLWMWGALLVVLAVAFGFWTLGMVMQLVGLLSGPQ